MLHYVGPQTWVQGLHKVSHHTATSLCIYRNLLKSQSRTIDDSQFWLLVRRRKNNNLETKLVLEEKKTRALFPENVIKTFGEKIRTETDGMRNIIFLLNTHTLKIWCEYSQVTTDRWNVARSWCKPNLQANCPARSSVMFNISREQPLDRYSWPYSSTYCWGTFSAVTRRTVLLELGANSQSILLQLPFSCRHGKVTLSPFLKRTDSESATVRIKKKWNHFSSVLISAC